MSISRPSFGLNPKYLVDKMPLINHNWAGYNSTLVLLRVTWNYSLPVSHPCFCPITSCYRTATATRLQYVTNVSRILQLSKLIKKKKGHIAPNPFMRETEPSESYAIFLNFTYLVAAAEASFGVPLVAAVVPERIEIIG